MSPFLRNLGQQRREKKRGNGGKRLLSETKLTLGHKSVWREKNHSDRINMKRRKRKNREIENGLRRRVETHVCNYI